MAKEKKEKPLKKESLIIKFQHLNPALQEMIGRPNKKETLKKIILMENPTIRDKRRGRVIAEGSGLLCLPAISSPLAVYSSVGIGLAATGRTFFAKAIQKQHKELVSKMKKFGLLQTKFEGNYPRDWINPATVARTHPVFFVNYKGDLIFPKMTRTEYARYVFQKRFPGKLGLNPWRWRAYLEPPERPEKVSEFVKAKIRQWLAVAKPRPAYGLAKARAKARHGKARPRRRRRV